MTKEEVKRLRGHWSTPELALKDAFRMLLHARVGCAAKDCSTCDYIEKRLRETGFLVDHVLPQRGGIDRTTD